MNSTLKELLSDEYFINNLKANFRTWHVEALLNQSADLIEKCIADQREIRSLEHQIQTFEINLDNENRLFENENSDKQRNQYLIDIDIANNDFTFFDDSIKSFESSRDSIDNATKDPRQDNIHLILKSKYEKQTEDVSRSHEKEHNRLLLLKAKQNKDYYNQYITDRSEIIKKIQAQNENGSIFKLKTLIIELNERLGINFKDAYNRLIIASIGLRDIYGYTVFNFPTNNVENVSDLYICIRDAIESIVAYQQLDQAFTRAISIRGILGEVQWKILATSQVPFSLNPILFSQHENVRFRGIGASIVGKAGIVPWAITITLPAKGIYVRNGADIEIGQDDLPSCLIGKVENRNSFKPLEYCGTVSLMNASPINAPNRLWLISLEKPEKTNEDFPEIDDIILEINVVGQPIKI